MSAGDDRPPPRRHDRGPLTWPEAVVALALLALLALLAVLAFEWRS